MILEGVSAEGSAKGWKERGKRVEKVKEGYGGGPQRKELKGMEASHPSLLLPAVFLLLSSPSHMTTSNSKNHRAGLFPDADPCIRYRSYHWKPTSNSLQATNRYYANKRSCTARGEEELGGKAIKSAAETGK